jgi:hypothetical protein
MAWWLLNEELERIGKEAVVAQRKYYAWIGVQGLEELKINLRKDCSRLGRDSNPTLPEHDVYSATTGL